MSARKLCFWFASVRRLLTPFVGQRMSLREDHTRILLCAWSEPYNHSQLSFLNVVALLGTMPLSVGGVVPCPDSFSGILERRRDWGSCLVSRKVERKSVLFRSSWSSAFLCSEKGGFRGRAKRVPLLPCRLPVRCGWGGVC